MLAFSLFYYIHILFYIFYVVVMKNIVKFSVISLWVFVSFFSFFDSMIFSPASALSLNQQTGDLIMMGNVVFAWSSPAWVWFIPSQLSFLPNGNVGVGIANPTSKLQVNGNVSAKSYSFAWVNTGWIWFGPLQLIFSSNGNIGIGVENPAFRLHINWPMAATNYFFSSSVGSIWYTSSQLTFLSNGNVGVGTTTPNYKLHVTGPVAATAYVFSWVNAGSVWYSNSQLTFIPNGNIGVGITNPWYKLHINGTVAATNYMFTWVNIGTVWYTTSQLTFLPNGNIGIGMTNPTYKLSVSWQVIADGFYMLSDEKFKTDITPLNNALEEIMKLNGYSFTRKETGKKDIGLLAQEVERVFPDLVNTDSEGTKAVKYMNIIAPLVESIKSLYKENLALKEGYTKLQDQVNALQQPSKEENIKLDEQARDVQNQLTKEEYTKLQEQINDLQNQLSTFQK